MQIKLLLAWLKTNSFKILLIVGLILVLIIIALAWWLKIKSFKVTDLLLKLQVANAESELNYLETKKKVIESKEEVSKSDIKEISDKIKEEKKKAVKKRLQLEGMTNDQIVDRFNQLGF